MKGKGRRMKKILKIKWENIMLMLLLSSTTYGWFVFFKYATEIKMLVMMLISTLMVLITLLGYKTIATFRKQVLKLW